jgi:WD40 repeat protein
LAIGLVNGTVAVLDYKRGSLLYIFGDKDKGQTFHHGSVVALAWAPGGRLFSSSSDGNIQEWNLLTGQANRIFRTDKGVTRIAVDAEGTRLATGHYSIKVWDLASERVVKKFGGHATPITDLQFSPDNNYLTSTAADRFVNVWALNSDKENAFQGTWTNTFPSLFFSSLPQHVSLHFHSSFLHSLFLPYLLKALRSP